MSNNKTIVLASAVACVFALSGCAGPQGTTDTQASGVKRAPADATPTQGPTTVIGKSAQDNDTEMVGKAAPNSKFARLKFRMSPQQVMNAIGAPADTTTHETGKRWIPFYFGPDARRTEVVYPGEGCLTFTGGNIYGGGSNELIKIEVDPSGKCFNS
jgi:outer membrane protein assembly factor BamE (lipoprotein component of BamABCDE complex)